MHKNAIYMVEDLHTAYWEEFGGGLEKPETFINFAKHCVDRLNADHTRGKLQPDEITRQTFGISFYDSIVCFEKGDVWWKISAMTGKNDGLGAPLAFGESVSFNVKGRDGRFGT